MPSPKPPPDPLSSEARPALVVAILLAFVGGYADAGGYLLTSSFTGHATGNAVLLTIKTGGALLTYHFPAWGLGGALVPLAGAWMASPRG